MNANTILKAGARTVLGLALACSMPAAGAAGDVASAADIAKGPVKEPEAWRKAPGKVPSISSPCIP